MSSVKTIEKGGMACSVNLENGQMFRLEQNGVRVLHEGGRPKEMGPVSGWPNTEFLMFPVIGKPPNNKIRVNGESFDMTQHGISRYLPWTLINPSSRDPEIRMVQGYLAGTGVPNRKDGLISEYPASFNIEKAYKILETEEGMVLEFTAAVEALDDLIYSIGNHPTFKTVKGGLIIPNIGKEFTDADVEKAEHNVILRRGVNEFAYMNSKFAVGIRHDYGSTMFWNNGEGQLGGESISADPISRIEGSDVKGLEELEGYRRLKRWERDIWTYLVGIGPPQ